MKLLILIYLLYFTNVINGSIFEYIFYKIGWHQADFSCPYSMPQEFVGVSKDEGDSFSMNPIIFQNLVQNQYAKYLKEQTIILGNEKKLKNIQILKFKLRELAKYIQQGNGLLTYFCSGSKDMKNVYMPVKNFHDEKIEVLRQTKTIPCTVDTCKIGLFFVHNMNCDEYCFNKFARVDKISRIFYIVFEPDDQNKGIYFEGVSGDFFPLVPCPYHNWVVAAYITRYQVRGYVVKGGQSAGKEFFDTNVYIPAFAVTNTHHHNKYFVCGELIQEGEKNIEIGFKVTLNNLENNELRGNNIKIEGGKVYCKGKVVDQKNSYGYVDSSYNIISGKSEMIYFGEGFKFYYNQIILVYKSTSNELFREERVLLIFKKQIFKNYQPECAGYIKNVKMEFTFEIDKKEVLDVHTKKLEGDKEVAVVFLNKNYIEKGKIDIRCRGVKAGGRDARFDDFYELTFKTKLQRVLDDTLKENTQPALSELIFSSESDNVFGLYSCQIDCPGNCAGKNNLQDRNIMLLPESIFEATTNTKIYTDSKEYLVCDLKVNNFGELKFMHIQYRGKEKISYDVVRNIPEDGFKNNKSAIIYVGNKYKFTDGTTVECNYTAFDRPYMYQKKVMQYNDLRNQIDQVGNKILVPIIAGVGAAVFIIILVIVLVTFRIIKRRKKIKLLSKATSASGASSMSKSEFTRSTMSRSLSKSRGTRSKYSNSNSKSNKSNSSTYKTKGSKSKSKTGSFVG
ncbi:Hypothetical protein SRAE_1000314200 [Strongyloides ratti]|uniref:Uncharacterized protein n=1 Tax=Strongyloides ratti TaxID=34506 RepID=A0A090MX64_STRRB|nr:Hypothetical protein SRAE_1000314200 [Strongyloides ratti]CEF64889.1 Hypothetical protein SRAE_1000314200 [Strongyloides ratti]